MGLIKDIGNLDVYFRELNSNPGKLVVVDFHAVWCPPCRAIAPQVHRLAEANDIVVVKVDVDEAQDVASREGVQAMPTFLFYKDGRKVDEFRGAQKKTLDETVQKYK